jgi:hypothetical protein
VVALQAIAVILLALLVFRPSGDDATGRSERLLDRAVELSVFTSGQLAEICGDMKALLLVSRGINPDDAGFYAVNCAAAQNVYVP